MSEVKKYAQQVDELAQRIFGEYNKAVDGLKQAEQAFKTLPQGQGGTQGSNALRAKAALVDAQEMMIQVRRKMDTVNDDVSSIRKELAAALVDVYAAKPEDVDAATLELLKSGVLKSHEFARLMNSAAAKGNHTMMRIISQYATTAAEEASAKYGASDHVAREFRVIAHQGDTDPVSSKLEQFDLLANTFKRTMRNPAMISRWKELTSHIIENF